MKMDLKESKLRLTALQIDKKSLQDDLEKVRTQKRNTKNILHEKQEITFGEEQASYLFKHMFEKY
jgi:hypothetical protein